MEFTARDGKFFNAQGQEVNAAIVMARLKELEDNQKQPGVMNISFKTAEKSGGMSCYGLMRFPVTLGAKQWQHLLDHTDQLKAALAKHIAGTLEIKKATPQG